MSIGETIKTIRTAKKITSKILYKDILSRPAIARFERGLSDTSATKLFIILERLNITLEEFEKIRNDEENKDFLYTVEYIEAFYLKDVVRLRELAELANNDYKKTSNFKYQHYRATINLLIDDIQNTNLYSDEVNILQSYLVTCESWGYYEIQLFSNSLSFYSDELIEIVYKRAKDTLVDFQDMKRYKNEIALLIFNILEKKVSNGDIKSAIFFINELEKLESNVIDNMYLQSMIKFFTGIVLYMSGDLSKKREVEKVIEFIGFLEMDYKEEQCRILYEKVVKECKETRNI